VTYLSVSQKLDVHPSRVLFIGDDRESDVVGPAEFGMKTAQLCRHLSPLLTKQLQPQPQEQQQQPDLLLTSLAVPEVRRKLYQKFLSPA
jgi:FMN phosphatase YigB (HAD superfamily)